MRGLDEPVDTGRAAPIDVGRIDATTILDAYTQDTPGLDAPGLDAFSPDAPSDAARIDASSVDAPAPDAWRAPDAGSDLIAWYPFEATRDATGLGHTLTSSGAVTFIGRIATLGAGAMVSTPSAPDLDETVALSFWVRPTSLDGEIGSRTTLISREGQILVFVRFTALPRCTLAGSTVNSTTALVASVWTHIACVRDATTLTFYTNGVATGMIDAAGMPTASSSDLRLGLSSSGTDPLFGDLSDVRLYRRAPTAMEITALAAVPP